MSKRSCNEGVEAATRVCRSPIRRAAEASTSSLLLPAVAGSGGAKDNIVAVVSAAMQGPNICAMSEELPRWRRPAARLLVLGNVEATLVALGSAQSLRPPGYGSIDLDTRFYSKSHHRR